MRWTLGFAAWFATAVVFEVILIVLLAAASNSSFEPRGVGWFVFPLGAGVAAGSYAMAEDGNRLSLSALASSLSTRLAAAALASWWICVVAYLWIAEPYGRYAPLENAFDSLRSGTTMKWLMGPPLAVAAIVVIFRFAVRMPADRTRSLPPP